MSYDTIGQTYIATRQADPRIAARIRAALGNVASVVNVGAGAGSYEPTDCAVVAVEPSRTMIGQRAREAAPVVQAIAELLPFPDNTFDAALAVLTVHHWTDVERGLQEMQRVARRQIVFYFEPVWSSSLWLVTDYFPEIVDLPTEQRAPDGARLAETLRVERTEVVPVPADCTDGFGACYWNRPERYLEPAVQAGMSCFAQLEPATRAARTEQLRSDLASGAWDAKHGPLRRMDERDFGYRLLVAGLP
jgi:SAM-dependent methyltransferase